MRREPGGPAPGRSGPGRPEANGSDLRGGRRHGDRHPSGGLDGPRQVGEAMAGEPPRLRNVETRRNARSAGPRRRRRWRSSCPSGRRAGDCPPGAAAHLGHDALGGRAGLSGGQPCRKRHRRSASQDRRPDRASAGAAVYGGSRSDGARAHVGGLPSIVPEGEKAHPAVPWRRAYGTRTGFCASPDRWKTELG